MKRGQAINKESSKVACTCTLPEDSSMQQDKRSRPTQLNLPPLPMSASLQLEISTRKNALHKSVANKTVFIPMPFNT